MHVLKCVVVLLLLLFPKRWTSTAYRKAFSHVYEFAQVGKELMGTA